MELYLINSLEKVFLDKKPGGAADKRHHCITAGDVFSFQAALRPEGVPWTPCGEYSVEIESEIKDIIRVRQVGLVPSMLPAYYGTGNNYLRDDIGFYPDPLEEKELFTLFNGKWNALWFDIAPEKGRKAGSYEIKIHIKDKKGNTAASAETSLRIIDLSLPESPLVHTEWFHTDCLAQYYKTEVFSEEYWLVVENFMKAAVEMGINMLLTPVVTPPLDTEAGGERLTVQLTDIYYENGAYSFCFDKLGRWINLAQSAGIQYFEIAHLFTQWGVEHAPKIMVYNEGALIKKFGWETEAAGDEYTGFLQAFIPALRSFLREKGVEGQSYFHISDEPGTWCLEQYRKIKNIMKPLLEECKMFDALSDAEFYEEGLVEIPVISTDHYEEFERFNIKEKWVYYCSGQSVDVSNRFFATPSPHTRILGVQMYLYEINGFLQWGFNFYNSALSRRAIDPYTVTDCDIRFPSGDAFIVYPGAGGKALASIRSMVFTEGLTDYKALKYLESLAGREFTLALAQEGFGERITFKKYPKSADYLLDLRVRVLEEIEKRVKK